MPTSIRPFIHPLIKTYLENHSELFHLSTQHSGPIHVIFPEIMTENIQKFKTVFEELQMEYAIHYAHKTNKSPALLKQALALGINLDVASKAELINGLSAGFTGEKISCTGPKSQEFLLLAIQHKCLISIDSISELNSILDLKKKHSLNYSTEILIRVNNLQNNDRKILPKATKFGVSKSEIQNITEILSNNQQIILRGVHFHFDEFQSEIKSGAIQDILDTFRELHAQGFSPDIIDIGGGFRGIELAHKQDWEKYIDFLSESKKNKTDSETWGNRAYGIQVNDRGGIDGREVATKRYREIDNSKFLKEILLNQIGNNQPIQRQINDSLFKIMIEPGYALTNNLGFSILKVESIKTLNNGDQAVITNSNISNLSSRMWEYFLDPILIKSQATKTESSPEFNGYLLGNLCRDDDVLIQRKISFKTTPQIGDLIILINTASYITDFEDANPIMQSSGKRFVVSSAQNFKFIPDSNI